MSDTTDIVNTGISVLKLLANHAGVQTVQGGYANGLPAGQDGAGMSGWTPRSVGKQWYHNGPWYHITEVNMDFTVALHWNYGGETTDGLKCVDQVTVTMDVNYLPVDQTVDVTVNFPPHGLNYGGGVAGLGFTTTVEMKYIFGQAEGWRKSFECLVKGDGDYSF